MRFFFMCKQKRQMDGIILLSTIAIFCMMKHDFSLHKKVTVHICALQSFLCITVQCRLALGT